MTIFDALVKLSTAASGLVSFLTQAGQKSPDLKPKADELIAALNSAATPANLIALAEALPRELANIAQGKLDPHSHPSDAA